MDGKAFVIWGPIIEFLLPLLSHFLSENTVMVGDSGSTNVGTVVTGFSDTQLRDSAKRGDWEV